MNTFSKYNTQNELDIRHRLEDILNELKKLEVEENQIEERLGFINGRANAGAISLDEEKILGMIHAYHALKNAVAGEENQSAAQESSPGQPEQSEAAAQQDQPNIVPPAQPENPQTSAAPVASMPTQPAAPINRSMTETDFSSLVDSAKEKLAKVARLSAIHFMAKKRLKKEIVSTLKQLGIPEQDHKTILKARPEVQMETFDFIVSPVRSKLFGIK